jgi:hypothetical protein
MNPNPLRQHFRQPQIYITLPSNGKFWPEGSINIPVSGELPVYSMTAADEILLLTPDALLNGEATVQVIQNCIPGVIDAWNTPSVDLETLLISIRIASVGDQLTIEAQCPGCKQSHQYDVDLKTLLQKFDIDLWTRNLPIGELQFQFAPLSYRDLNQYNLAMFKCRKKIQQIPEIADPDEKEHLTNALLTEFNTIDLEFLMDSICCIRDSKLEVRDRQFIREFIQNCDKKIYSQVRHHVEQLRNSCRLNAVNLSCSECNQTFTTEITLDYASFFALGS